MWPSFSVCFPKRSRSRRYARVASLITSGRKRSGSSSVSRPNRNSRDVSLERRELVLFDGPGLSRE
jgi:hypothetical protein